MSFVSTDGNAAKMSSHDAELIPCVPKTLRQAADKPNQADQQSKPANEPLRFETVIAAVSPDHFFHNRFDLRYTSPKDALICLITLSETPLQPNQNVFH